MLSGRLRRSDRLRLSRDFQRVGRQGLRTASRDFVMLISSARSVDRRVASSPVRRIGITASRKVGGAVARNRVKRAIREWFRHSRESLPGDVDVVVIARPGAAALSGPELASGLSRLVEQASHD